MGGLIVPQLFGILAMSILASLAVLWALGLRARPGTVTFSSPLESAHLSSFLFQGDNLVDHDIPAPQGHGSLADTFEDWSDLRPLLAERFDGLPKSLSSLPDGASRIFEAQVLDAPFTLTLIRSDETIRAELRSDVPPVPFSWLGALVQSDAAYQAQTILDHAPLPLWKIDSTGRLTWRNAKGSEMERDLGEPPQHKVEMARFSLPERDSDSPRWFEMNTQPLDEGQLLYATDVTSVIRAETAQRDFVQTLAKTFGHLTTGLAVFDKNRQLALFNPALVDLTGLPVSFLSARPDVLRFFDELRERQVLPEPKNYKDWRDQIRDMIAQADDGTYTEIWNLPAGVTYRVTGRPHPDGAVAFLFQDISAEIMQTRTFRSQIDLGQAVIDGLDEAIVVISSGNVVLMCNSAASELVGIDPGTSFADMSLNDLLEACRVRFAGDALWTVFEAGLRDGAAHQKGPGRYLNSASGQRLRYQIKPLTGGARLLSFTVQPRLAQSAPVNAAE